MRFRILMCALLLSGCGGGGGGGGGQSSLMSVNPKVLVQDVFEGEQAFVGAVASVSLAAQNAAAYILIADVNGVFLQEFEIVPNYDGNGDPDGTYSVTFHLDPGLSAGLHQGDLAVHFCGDMACTSELSGSPVLVPYEVNVHSHIGNLNALAALGGASDWGTLQGGSSRAGYQPVSLDPNLFSFRWYWRNPGMIDGVPVPVHSVVSSQERVSLSTASLYPDTHALYQLSESDGSVVWQKNFLSMRSIDPPAMHNGITYMVTTDVASNSTMHAFDVGGNAVFSTPFVSQWGQYLAPVVDGGVLYALGGYSVGTIAYDAANGGVLWTSGYGAHSDAAVAVDGDHVYVHQGMNSSMGFSRLDRATGAEELTVIEDNSFTSSSSPGATPILTSTGSLVIYLPGSRALWGYDPANGNVEWKYGGDAFGVPAEANGVIYVMDAAAGALVALNAGSGAAMWSWPLPGSNGGRYTGDDEDRFCAGCNVIVTDNMVFVSTNQAVHAIDLGTHQSVWSYPFPGKLSMSRNGILYVMGARRSWYYGASMGSNGTVIAINLH